MVCSSLHMLAESPPPGDVLSSWNENQSQRCGGENVENAMETTNAQFEPAVECANKINQNQLDVSF